MAALVYDCIMEQGTTFDNTVYPPFAIKDSTGAILDLTNYTARSNMRKKFSDVSATASFTCTKTVLTGLIQLSMTATQTAAIPSGSYFYDIEIYTSADAIVRRIVQGTITVSAEATK